MPLIDPWARVLREHVERQGKRKAKLGDRWVDSGFLFVTEVGTPFNPRNYQRIFDAVLKKAGLPKVRLHSLRHVANTVLALLGVHPRIAMQITGCSDVRTQMKVYTKVVPASVREVAEAIGRYYTNKGETGKQCKNIASSDPTTDSVTDRAETEVAA